MAFAGGEVLGLSWRDVETGVIRVRQQLVRAGGRLRLGPVKSAAGRRELPLIGIAKDVPASGNDLSMGVAVTVAVNQHLEPAAATAAKL